MRFLRFPYLDENLEHLTQCIKHKQEALGKEKPQLPLRSIPWTAGFIQLTLSDDQKPVRSDFIDILLLLA